jgi:hypothetical protein
MRNRRFVVRVTIALIAVLVIGFGAASMRTPAEAAPVVH